MDLSLACSSRDAGSVRALATDGRAAHKSLGKGSCPSDAVGALAATAAQRLRGLGR